MRYFKLIKEQKIFGIITDSNFRKYQKKHNLILYSNVDTAEFIKYNNTFYWDNWLNPYPAEIKNIRKKDVYTIRIDQIEQEEYQILKKTLQTEEEIINIESPLIKEEQQNKLEKQFILQQPQQEESLKVELDETLQYIRKVKILELQRDNQKKIEQGSDITLENGKTYHFSFDNMGLFNLITTMNTQQEPQENISFILQKMNEFKQQCDSYCNSLIQQVQSSKDIKEINDIHYEKEGDN